MENAGGAAGLRMYSFTEAPGSRIPSIAGRSISSHDDRLVHFRLLLFLAFGGGGGRGRGRRSGLRRRVLGGHLLGDAVELLLALVERLRLLLERTDVRVGLDLLGALGEFAEALGEQVGELADAGDLLLVVERAEEGEPALGALELLAE